jgi:hypothetical protein
MGTPSGDHHEIIMRSSGDHHEIIRRSRQFDFPFTLINLSASDPFVSISMVLTANMKLHEDVRVIKVFVIRCRQTWLIFNHCYTESITRDHFREQGSHKTAQL